MYDVHEISDVVYQTGPSGERRPVAPEEALGLLTSRWARRIVASLPTDPAGHLDPSAVDQALLRSHCELQRLNEEFQQGQRVLRLLRPMLDALRRSGVQGPYRVVDVGCGIGFVVRWLTAHGELGFDVELIGHDYNARFIDTANLLARREHLDCSFRLGDALAQTDAHIAISTGVLHHFRGESLTGFFARQRDLYAFAHFDIQPSWLAPVAP